jgi:predicted nucleotidyltransferase component of viral defense system
MKISRRRLLDQAQSTGFRPEVLEKVIQLLNLLQGFYNHPFLKDKLVLKGGTALNLFLFDLPRLSVDIDLNYIGSINRETMTQERPKIEQAVQAVCSREGMNITHVPGDHAGGKWRLRYDSSIGEGGNLEVDLNFMFRLPLWPVIAMDATVGSYSALQIPVLDIHELVAGKLAALLARHASRDLFDAHHILTKIKLENEKIRLGFVLYGAMNRKDWRTVSIDDIDYDKRELENQLMPVVRRKFFEKSLPANWAQQMVQQCKESLSVVLPLTDNEKAFLDAILDHGEIKPNLLTEDAEMVEKITTHPLLQWKAVNVRQHKGK